MVLFTDAWAQPKLPHAPTENELLMLPEECQATRKGGQPAEAYAKRLQVQGITGISHYCAGLNFINRAKFVSRNKTGKRFNLQSAIGEFDYVLGHSAPNATGLQTIQAQKELAEMMLKNL
jgi:hypothetical protein